MKRAFVGFPAEGMQFLADLKENNDREWFNPRKAVFETKVKEPMLDLIRAIHGAMVKFAPDYIGDPAKSIYRIYRDVRFSKNKVPYKPHVAALFWRKGFGKDDGAALFFLVAPEGIEIAGGLYAPMPDTLLAERQYIAENAAAFRKTYSGAKVKKLLGDLQGESVTRMPKGFDPEDSSAELIKKKQYVLATKLDGSIATTPKLFTEVVARLEAMTPFVEFLNKPLLDLPRKVEAKFYEK